MSNDSQIRHARRILRRLVEAHPDATCELNSTSPYQLLVATILSAQCTDARVNAVTPDLFATYPTAGALAGADSETLEQLIRPTGFFRSKARSLVRCSQAIVEGHGGQVPCRMEDLVTLPGVGRKTANVVLAHACGAEPEGIVVDTHVLRVARRLGFTDARDASRIEEDLQNLFPRKSWVVLGDTLIFHGRRICHARRPSCATCPVASDCPSQAVSTRPARR